MIFKRKEDTNADEKELDEQFATLHDELFANYDCNRCRNCCKMYHGSIPVADVEKDSLYLGIASTEFIKQYLNGKDSEGNYQTKHKPCDFLQADGSCKLGNCKPGSRNQTKRNETMGEILGFRYYWNSGRG